MVRQEMVPSLEFGRYELGICNLSLVFHRAYNAQDNAQTVSSWVLLLEPLS